MQVTLSTFHEQVDCTWCERTRDCVSTTFSDGFLKESPLCWKCLQTAYKVRMKQHESKGKDKADS